MSVVSFAEGDLFRITIMKYLATNPDRKWGNNYELRSKFAGVTSDLTAVGLRLVGFEQSFHFDAVQFDRLRISTWEEDSKPYDPTVFISLPLNAAGNTAVGSGELVALNICWDVARVPITGRFGHVYFRGCLVESRVNAPAGKYKLQDPPGMALILTTGIEDGPIDSILNGSDAEWELVMINKTGTNVRELIALSSRGVATVPFDHAWFNRTPAP